MKTRIVNPTYSYVKGGDVTVSATLEVLTDDEATVVTSTSVSYQANLSRPDFRQFIAGELARQAQDYVDQLRVVAGLVYGQFGTTDFNEAVAIVATEASALVDV